MPELDDFQPPALIPTLPALSGEEELAAAESVFDEPEVEAEERIPFGRSWLFDFEKQEFVLQGTDPAPASGMDSLKMWILNTLYTSRFSSPIHSDDYGIEVPDDILGSPVDAMVTGIIERSITEALMVHDRITEVERFTFATDEEDGTILYVDFVVTTDDGSETLISNVPVG